MGLMKSHQQKQFTLSELVRHLDVTIQGDPDCIITGVAPVHQAEAGHITFLTNAQYRKFLPDTAASAVILNEADAALCKVNAVICANPYYVYSQIAASFDNKPPVSPGIHPSAVIGQHCDIHPSASIGPQCSVGDYVSIGADTVLDAVCQPERCVAQGAAARQC